MFAKNRTLQSNIATEADSLDLSDLKDRIKLVARLQGGNSALARIVDSAESTVRKWIKGESEPKYNSLVAIATAANISLEWLMSGKGEVRVQSANSKTSNLFNEKSTPLEKYLERGFEIWISDNSNMEPTVHEGEICLVEPSKDGVPKDGVYLIRIGGVEKIQRLQRLPDAIVLTNDNLAYRASDVRIELNNRDFPIEFIGRIYRGSKAL